MKRFGVAAIILAAVATGATMTGAHAQHARAPAGLQMEYNQFIVKFRGALKANDGAAVAAMTKFPFYWNEFRDAAYFRKNIYAKVFTSRVHACIARGKGAYARDQEGGENFTIFCGQELFLFTKTPASFRFSETGVND